MSNLFSSGGAGNVGFSGETQQSLKFNDDESQYLSWTPAAAGNRKTWTYSVWLKRGANITATVQNHALLSNSDGSQGLYLRVNPNDPKIDFACGNGNLVTNALYRDHSAWYHIVAQYDSANSTMKLYVNGEQVTDLATNTQPSLNTDGNVNDGNAHYIGRQGTLSRYLDGYLSDVYFIDGQALDASSFGQFTNGYWEAKNYAGTYGTNGFHLTFEDDVVSEGFNAVTYAGTGADQSISGLGFEPDFVWIKQRDGTPSHALFDSVRGADNVLRTNGTDAENASGISTALYGGLTSFDSDGFTVDDGTDTTYDATNGSGDSYVAWAWDAGSGSAASNTDGSITSTVKANPSYGFSIVSYTGNGSSSQTVGHGLGAAPDLLIMKNRDDAENWQVNHSSITDGIFNLNTTDAKKDHTAFSTGAIDPAGNTSTVFSMYDGSSNTDYPNESGKDYIVYCFAEVAGYSSIGSYSGTDSPGVTVTTGFRPAFVMIKATNLVEGWAIIDGTRDTINPRNKVLKPNSSNAEVSGSQFDIEFTDTGFVLNGTDDVINGYSGGTGEYIYMAFADTREAAFWKDVSGQGNHWTPNNLDYRDSLIDSPANNFCTGNPLKSYTSGSAMVYAEGNLKLDRPGTGTGWASSFGTMSVSSGKWYWEAKCFDSGSADEFIGIHEANTSMFQIIGYSGDPTGYSYNASTGNKYNNNTGTSYGSSYGDGDVIGVALDMDAGTVTFYKNGVSQGTAFTGLSGDFIPAFSSDYSTGYGYWIANFGQDSTFAGATTAGGNQDDNGIGDFKYAPPSGYLALCTANLPTPTIVDGSTAFNTVLYTGNASTNAVTGVGFGSAPDFVWLKGRSYAEHHHLYDTIRGATEVLYSNRTVAEASDTLGLTSFDSDGFSIGSRHEINNSGDSFVGWSWKAGGAAVSNTDGSITSQVSANVDAGFSVVSWTGTGANATVGHGLNSAPEMIIPKDRDSGNSWSIYHSAIGAGKYMNLNETISAQTNSAVWQGVEPTSSVFSIGTSGNINQSGDDFIAYCFHSVDGYSKVGSYEANNSTDGPFVYCGFRPAFVIMKGADYAVDWFMFDAQRDVDNVVREIVYSNSSAAEASSDSVDFLSNGFKVRNSGAGGLNYTGTYIFLAFAETPQKFANAR